MAGRGSAGCALILPSDQTRHLHATSVTTTAAAARLKSTEAMLHLCSCYLLNKGVHRCLTTALFWLNQAASKGSSEGWYLSGVAQESGSLSAAGMPQCAEQAAKSYECVNHDYGTPFPTALGRHVHCYTACLSDAGVHPIWAIWMPWWRWGFCARA
jgi:hypothetical protein